MALLGLSSTYGSGFGPSLMVASVAGGFNAGSSAGMGNIWAYRSTDALATVVGSSYFADGFARGMRKGDMVSVYDTNTPKMTWCWVTAVTTAPSGAQSGAGATVAAFST